MFTTLPFHIYTFICLLCNCTCLLCFGGWCSWMWRQPEDAEDEEVNSSPVIIHIETYKVLHIQKDFLDLFLKPLLIEPLVLTLSRQAFQLLDSKFCFCFYPLKYPKSWKFFHVWIHLNLKVVQILSSWKLHTGSCLWVFSLFWITSLSIFPNFLFSTAAWGRLPWFSNLCKLVLVYPSQPIFVLLCYS